jgi:amino acid transporter
MAMRAEPTPSGAQASLPTALVVGFAIASIGGPLALLTLLPDTAGDAVGSAGLIAILSLAVFAIPLGIWLAFSGEIVSGGGLSAFVEAAIGRRAAVVHGWIWAFAYFLYLPYTVTFVVYDMLPPVFPGVSAYRSSLELVVPVVIVVIMLVPVRAMLIGLGLLAAVQLVLMVVLAVIEFSHSSAHLASHPELSDASKATGNTALLFVCASLPLYLGAEVRGGSRTMQRALLAAVVVVGAAFLALAIPFAGLPDELRDAAVPGAAIAQAYSGRGLAVVVGLFTAASTLALIICEYVALARLIHWLHGPPIKSLLRWIAVPFILADAISLIDPDRFYDDLLKPSLGALFISQIAVFAAFPRFRRGSLAIGAAVAASALAVWGLYTLFAGGASS